ncbi:MAG: DUF6428 family protein [Verrucomicrobiota bacterium]
MTIEEINNVFAATNDKALRLVLPDKSSVPAHFHITEVGYVKKEFIDCGGTVRTEEGCRLQIWVANDVDHRVSTAKFIQILEHGDPVLPSRDIPVTFEYGNPRVSLYGMSEVVEEDDCAYLILENKQTDCLAKDVCGITPANDVSSCGPNSGCC